MAKKGFAPFFTRTMALVGHRSAGKTSLGDLLLQATGATRGIGRVEEGTSLLDHTAEAKRRKQTLEPGHAWLTWRAHLLNLIDVPGAPDLFSDTSRVLAAVDSFVLVVAANDGPGAVGGQVLERVGDQPGLVVLQQIDRPHDLDLVLAQLGEHTDRKLLPLQLPFFDDEGEFAGIVDLATRTALRFDPDGTGAYSPEPLPDRLRGKVEAAWERVIEAVALADEDRLERYLEYLELPEEEVLAGLSEGVKDGTLLPVLLTSAERGVGAELLLDAMVDLLPEPRLPEALAGIEPDGFLATVVHCSIDPEGRPYSLVRIWSGDAERGGNWISGETGRLSKVRKVFQVRGPRRATAHTTGPGAVIATWDRVDARGGETLTEGERMTIPQPELAPVMVRRRLQLREGGRDEILDRALPVLLAMDPGLVLETDPIGGEPVLGARTDGQLERAGRWLTERMGVPVELLMPRVAYREAPVGGTWGIEGLHVREVAGLVEEYGRCCLDLDPDADCDEVAFETSLDEEDVPRRFWGALALGAKEAALQGPLAGYPVIGARVTCREGQYDMLCSTEDHFHKAGAAAMREALQSAGTRLLEPWQQVVVHAPAPEVGAVLQDLTSHRGRILDVRVDGEAIVEAVCPERETRTLAARLGALTAGRGWFSADHSHYDVLPEPLVAEAMRSAPGPADPASLPHAASLAMREVRAGG